MRSWHALAGALILGGLAGCGGGGSGGGGDAAPQVFSFPPPTAATFASAAIFQYAVSGDCTGAMAHLRGAATAASFGGQAVTGVTTTTDRVLANCTAAGSTTNWQTGYYDANFAHVGADNSSGSMWVDDAPYAVPATLKVGDAGTYGTATLYADTARTKVLEREVLSYAVQANPDGTALAVLTATLTDPSGNLLLTDKATYQLRQGASPVLQSVDDQFATTSTLHLVYTPGTAAITLSAGSTVTLGAGQMLLVPAGTTATASGSTSAVQGHQSTIVAPAGAVVTVPANATGPADDVVMAR